MPEFQVHRLKDPQRQNYLWAPHTSGLTVVKPKDYEAGETVAADSVYAVWEKLRVTDRPLAVGDILEFKEGQLRICKYVGFEEASWFVLDSSPVQAAIADSPAHAVI